MGVHVQWIMYTGGLWGYMIDTIHWGGDKILYTGGGGVWVWACALDNVPWGAVGVHVQWIMYPGGLWGVHDRYCTLGGCGGYMIDTVH